MKNRERRVEITSLVCIIAGESNKMVDIGEDILKFWGPLSWNFFGKLYVEKRRIGC